jgi:L-proline amide hydrolase
MPTTTIRNIPFRNWTTWTSITEPDVPTPGALPLIVLHGGPGFPHNYLQSITALAESGRTVVLYDQLGCGASSHLPDAPSEFWTVQLFIDEFTNLVEALGFPEYHILGQSWGGMLGAEIATLQPTGLRSLIASNSSVASARWRQSASDLRAQLPAEVRENLERHEASETYDHPDYLAATAVFYAKHVLRLPTPPEEYLESERQLAADPTVYYTMNGPNEFHVIGTMRDWSVEDRLPLITAPTLVLAGEFDEATSVAWQPFIDLVPTVSSHIFPGASHCTHLEQPEEFRAVVESFLRETEAAA